MKNSIQLKKFFARILMLTLVLSIVTFAGSCREDADESSSVNSVETESMVTYTVTENKWEESFLMSNITNARVSVSNLSMSISVETVEIEGENLRKLRIAERNGQTVGYVETIVTKEAEAYRYYYRISATDPFITGKRSAEEYTLYKAQEIMPYFDIVKAVKDSFVNASYNTTTKAYEVTIENYYYAAGRTDVTNAGYTIFFENDVLKSVFCTLTLNNEIFSAEFVFGDVSITVPAVAS